MDIKKQIIKKLESGVVILRGKDLPETSPEREDLADVLCEDFAVYVERRGSGRVGSYVASIKITRQLDEVTG